MQLHYTKTDKEFEGETVQKYKQGSIIGVRCVRIYLHFYYCMHDFGHAHVDTYAHCFSMISQVFKIFPVLIILYCLKTYCYSSLSN